MRRGLIGCIAAACAVALATSGTAFARAGERTLEQTYPVASALCAQARASTLPAKLAANRTRVLGACETLANAFGPLVTTVDDAEAAFLQTLATQRGLVTSACPAPGTDTDACRMARDTRRGTDATALLTRQTAVDQYHTSVMAARDAFWTTIEGLRSSS